MSSFFSTRNNTTTDVETNIPINHREFRSSSKEKTLEIDLWTFSLRETRQIRFSHSTKVVHKWFLKLLSDRTWNRPISSMRSTIGPKPVKFVFYSMKNSFTINSLTFRYDLHQSRSLNKNGWIIDLKLRDFFSLWRKEH